MERGIKNAFFNRGNIHVTTGITIITHTIFVTLLRQFVTLSTVQTTQKHPGFSHAPLNSITQEMFL